MSALDEAGAEGGPESPEARALAAAVSAVGRGVIVGAVPLSGGCIDRVLALRLDDGERMVAKVAHAPDAARLDAESAGLEALADTGTVCVPAVIGLHCAYDCCVLLLAHLEASRATDEDWGRFGAQLAALHASEVGGRYGFRMDNFLGTTMQPNGWSDDWVDFNRRRRLGPQVERASARGHLEPEERRLLERVIARLDEHLPRRPAPALLHGDLWSGNALPSAEGVAVIDPACSIGDGWADIAMMTLFGGFPARCLEAYTAESLETVSGEDLQRRIAVYQLYHLLNHLNLFGRAYAGQVMGVARRLG